jgi:hypothetical protein
MNVSIISVKEPRNARTDLKLNALDHKKEKVVVYSTIIRTAITIIITGRNFIAALLIFEASSGFLASTSRMM